MHERHYDSGICYVPLDFGKKNDINLNKYHSLCLAVSEFLVRRSHSFCAAIRRVDFTIFPEGVCTAIAVLESIHAL